MMRTGNTESTVPRTGQFAAGTSGYLCGCKHLQHRMIQDQPRHLPGKREGYCQHEVFV